MEIGQRIKRQKYLYMFFCPIGRTDAGMGINLISSSRVETVVQAINRVIKEKDDCIPGLKAAIEKAFVSNNAPKAAEIDEKLVFQFRSGVEVEV